MRKEMMTVCVLMAMVGCSTGPYTPMNAKTLTKGAKIIYLEQADRIPKDVMLESWKHQPVVAQTSGVAGAQAIVIPPEVLAEIIKEIMAAVPEIAKGYQNERQNEALMSRRMLFRGYQDAELKDINDIVKSLGWSIEYMTPQTKTAPAPSVTK